MIEITKSLIEARKNQATKPSSTIITSPITNFQTEKVWGGGGGGGFGSTGCFNGEDENVGVGVGGMYAGGGVENCFGTTGGCTGVGTTGEAIGETTGETKEGGGGVTEGGITGGGVIGITGGVMVVGGTAENDGAGVCRGITGVLGNTEDILDATVFGGGITEETKGFEEDIGGTIEICAGVVLEVETIVGSAFNIVFACMGTISLNASLKSSSIQPPPASKDPLISARVRPLASSPRIYPKSSGVIIKFKI